MRERSVRANLTNKRGTYTETHEYVGFVRRAIRGLTRRVGKEADVEELPAMLQLAKDMDDAITLAVAGLIKQGYSWAEIASRVGITRQTAHERWAKRVKALDQ